LNAAPVELANLQAHRVRLFKTGRNSVIFVRGDGSLEFQRVAEVIDIAKGAGISRVALMTE
jgi:biopolymer transport protein ExbD